MVTCYCQRKLTTRSNRAVCCSLLGAEAYPAALLESAVTTKTTIQPFFKFVATHPSLQLAACGAICFPDSLTREEGSVDQNVTLNIPAKRCYP